MIDYVFQEPTQVAQFSSISGILSIPSMGNGFRGKAFNFERIDCWFIPYFHLKEISRIIEQV